MKQVIKEGGESSERAQRPTSEQIRAQIRRYRHRKRYLQTLRSTVYILTCVAAIAVLIATLAFPVLKVVGTSMEPTLENGQYVLAHKYSGFETGDIVAFYYNNNILLKRVIAQAGDYVEISEDGTVYVNGAELQEPYLSEKSLGECDLDFPYQVPDGRIFVMGDHRATSIDSRSNTIGCISEEYIVGRVAARVWPLKDISSLR